MGNQSTPIQKQASLVCPTLMEDLSTFNNKLVKNKHRKNANLAHSEYSCLSFKKKKTIQKCLNLKPRLQKILGSVDEFYPWQKKLSKFINTVDESIFSSKELNKMEINVIKTQDSRG